MPNPMRKCGCPRCRFGMHHYRLSKGDVRRACRGFRHAVKQACAKVKKGEDPEVPEQFGVPYTD